jgi:hypothetical protein
MRMLKIREGLEHFDDWWKSIQSSYQLLATLKIKLEAELPVDPEHIRALYEELYELNDYTEQMYQAFGLAPHPVRHEDWHRPYALTVLPQENHPAMTWILSTGKRIANYRPDVHGYADWCDLYAKDYGIVEP